VTADGSAPVSLRTIVAPVGNPVVVTVNVPGVLVVNVVALALVIAGGSLTRTVKLCVASGAVPLVAVSVTGNDPLCVGAPDSRPAGAGVTAGGALVAVTLTVGAGEQVVAARNVVPAVFSLNVAVFALVIAGGALTRTVKLCVAFGSVPLVAVSVTGKDP